MWFMCFVVSRFSVLHTTVQSDETHQVGQYIKFGCAA